MTPERWQEVKELLGTALEMEPADRGHFLERTCAHDSGLRGEVERLLAAGDRAGTEFLKNPVIAGGLGETRSADAWIGRRVGPYKIVEQIGVGGMGEVYRAFRADDQYRKQVALKVVRASQDSAFVVSRFKNERQILARLDHPNIARLYDGGTTREGAPYFVMELIEGQPIDQYCGQHALSITERLKLFLQVCSAVQYAHQRLIIHRDIKPGNILVTHEGAPKLLDFGIAKILDTEAVTRQFEPTLTIFRVLTPGYASPEQVKGEPITTTSDIYSLGVVLYELLTGHHPYRRANSTPQEVARAVCEVEAEKPSTAARRGETPEVGRDLPLPAAVAGISGHPAEISKRLRGDLDNIVLMAMRKDPLRRYVSVEQFAEDVRHHLKHLPVVACKDTVGYRTSKFVARHRAGVTAAIVVLGILLVAMAITVRQARIAREQRARAEQRFNDVRELANSLMFDVHDSIQNLPGSTPARKLLVVRALHYLEGLSREAGSDLPLQRELAAAYAKLGMVQGGNTGSNLGDTKGALESFRRALKMREAVAAANPGNVQDQKNLAHSYFDLSTALYYAGDLSVGNEYVHKAVQIREALVQAHPSDTALLNDLAFSYRDLGGDFTLRNQLAEGLEQYEKSLELLQQVANSAPLDLERQRNLSYGYKRVCATLATMGKLSESLKQYEIALAIDEKLITANPGNAQLRYDITITYSDMGYALGKRGELDAALANYRKALSIREQLAAADPKDVKVRAGLARTYGYIGSLLGLQGRYRESLAAAHTALAIREKLTSTDPSNNRFREELARSHYDVGFASAALALKSRVSGEPVGLWRQAQFYLQRALPVWKQMEAAGHLAGDEVGAPQRIADKLTECKAALTKLEARAIGSRPRASELSSPGCGTVFQLSPSSGGGWTESIFYSFSGPYNGGEFPTSGVILDAAGNFHGTTNAGGVD
jgi:eukaryotic-like serine/threonine-protein kinase